MKIVIDIQGLQSPSSKNRGVGRYTLEMVKAFVTQAKDNHDVFLVGNGSLLNSVEEIREHFKYIIPYNHIKFWQQYSRDISGINGNSHERKCYEIIREWYISQLKPDVVWTTNLQEGWFDNTVTSVKQLPVNYYNVTTLHDVIPFIYPDDYLSTSIKNWYLEKIEYTKRCDLVFTVSEFSKKKIIEHLNTPPEKVIVAYNAVNTDIFNTSPNQACKKYITSDTLYILYVGGIDKHKNIISLLKGFRLFNKDQEHKFKIVFSGSLNQEQVNYIYDLAYSHNIEKESILFTGYVDDLTLASLYQNCQAFIFPSISEGFGLPLLEAISCGAPSIAAHSASLPEILPLEECLFDPHNPIDLFEKLSKIISDAEFRKCSIIKNLKYIKKFSWEHSASLLIEKIESLPLIQHNRSYSIGELLCQLASIPNSGNFFYAPLSQAIADNHIENIQPKIYLDISCIVHQDHATGIQRVVKAILNETSKIKHTTFTPIYSYADQDSFYFAKSNERKPPSITNEGNINNIVEFADGDIILFLDLHPANVISKRYFLQNLRSRGIKVFFLIYDLLPIEYPQYFVPELSKEFKELLLIIIKNDAGICISNDVKVKFEAWIKNNKLVPSSNFKTSFFHLGSDILKSIPSIGLPNNYIHNIKKIKDNISFIMIGTIEPRKGHKDILDAFEILWSKDEDIHLIIVGKEGWKNETFIHRLKNHPKLNHKLIWLEAISDEYLELIYQASTCLIAASEGEGFGLPLIEAAQHKIPIIARNLPVFREVAGDHAFYFETTNPENLAQVIKDWLALYEKKQHPTSDTMPWLTWKESAQQLLATIESLTN